MSKYYLGVDAGSTTLKAVLIDENFKVLNSLYERTKPAKAKPVSCTGQCFVCGTCNVGALKNTISTFLSDAGLRDEDLECTVVTGSQIIENTKDFIDFQYSVSEVTAHVAGAQQYYPDCKAILDVGGQDSKAMIYNKEMKMWTSKMSGICAAGTGAFLDSVAVKLAVPVEEMAAKADLDSELEFSSVCAVLSATSINKFKNRYPLGQIIGGACRAQARTIMSGVGELFYKYKGRIIFQGGVASNKAVRHYLKEVTGNEIVVPEYSGVMGALGAACIAKNYSDSKEQIAENRVDYGPKQIKSIAMRTKHTRRDFIIKKDEPLIWRNLFYPAEIINALDTKMLTLETYAALFARNRTTVKKSFDVAAFKGYTGAETCSFLRILEGIEVPKPTFGVSTSQPCLQGERIFQDLIRGHGKEDSFHSLSTPVKNSDHAVEHMAADLENSVFKMEKALGKKLDPKKFASACELSNEAMYYSRKASELRLKNPPLLRGSQAIYFANIFSQLWGRQGLVDIQKQYCEDLQHRAEELNGKVSINDTHRLLWLHLPPFYDTTILDYIEVKCNTPIVYEEVNGSAWTGTLDPKDPYRSLARKLLGCGFLDPDLRVRKLVELAKYGKFNGIVLYNHMFGKCSLSDASFMKHLREELTKELIPLLVLDGDCIDPTVDPCSTYAKINAFAEGLNDRKFGNIFGKID